MLSKILLVFLLGLLVSKLGLRMRLRALKPRFDRAINITIGVIAVAYAGQLVWWLIQGH